jgi:hypothetical protein
MNDGFRGMLYIEKGRELFPSKTMKVMRRFEELATALARVTGLKNATSTARLASPTGFEPVLSP